MYICTYHMYKYTCIYIYTHPTIKRHAPSSQVFVILASDPDSDRCQQLKKKIYIYTHE